MVSISPAGFAEVCHPGFHLFQVVWKDRALVGRQVDLFLGVVLKGKDSGAVFEGKLQRFFLVVFHHDFAGDDEVFGGLQEFDDGDGIAVDIALPVDLELRIDLQPG